MKFSAISFYSFFLPTVDWKYRSVAAPVVFISSSIGRSSRQFHCLMVQDELVVYLQLPHLHNSFPVNLIASLYFLEISIIDVGEGRFVGWRAACWCENLKPSFLVVLTPLCKMRSMLYWLFGFQKTWISHGGYNQASVFNDYWFWSENSSMCGFNKVSEMDLFLLFCRYLIIFEVVLLDTQDSKMPKFC